MSEIRSKPLVEKTGVNVVQRIGMDRFERLASLIDVDVHHAVEHLFKALEGAEIGE